MPPPRLPYTPLLVSFALAASAGGCHLVPPHLYPAPEPIPAAEPRPGATTLQPFASEEELAEFSERVERSLRQAAAREQRMLPAPAPPPPPPPPPPPIGPSVAGAESITSVQHQGVDEGGIVKVHGDYLVVLRRGRLFTVRIGGDALQPVAMVDAYAPGIDPRETWYDELLVSGDNVVVIGYSYARGGTELGIFRIGVDGSLAHRATYHLRSTDYYSPTNYASRLIGDRLVFYAPIVVDEKVAPSLPRMRRWDGGRSGWVRTASTQRIYRPAAELSAESGIFLHAVTLCDLGAEELGCESTAFFGPTAGEFYVSPTSVYVWATHERGWHYEGPVPSVLYRMPLDGAAPTGLRVTGRPLNQFSFLESADHLHVLTRPDEASQALWGYSLPDRLALLRAPLSALGDGSREAPVEMYRLLPKPGGYYLQNRYVGDWLLYGSGGGRGLPQAGPGGFHGVRWAAGEAVEVPLPHGVDRIEALGPHAMVIGADTQALHFTSVRLEPSAPRVADRYTRTAASQGETRSHGFFYRAEGEDGGVLGLPLRGRDRPGREHLRRGSMAIAFLRNRGLRLEPLGELAAGWPPDAGDDCRASCVDWYGNARPIFLRDRVFALMGYELVEGTMDGASVRERRRVDFGPPHVELDVTGEWTFSERILGGRGRYDCTASGTMRMEQRDTAVAMSYRQTGECTIDGAVTRSDGEGSGTGTLVATRLVLRVDACEYASIVSDRRRVQGAVRCQVRLPGGEELAVDGRWEAERVQP